MSETDDKSAAAQNTAAQNTAKGAGQLMVDLGPILVFVISYNVLNRIYPGEAVYYATGLFIAATAIAIFYAWKKLGRIPPVLVVTGVLVVAFGGLTLALHDPAFIKLKPTVVYLFYAAAIFGSLLAGQNIWKLLFRHAFSLPDRIWTILAVRWGLFFVFMAVVNEIIRRTQSTDFWVNSRLFLVFPLILLFGLANTPITLKHIQEEEKPQTPPA